MKIIKYLMLMPKTILFNFKVFPFKIAIKLPVLISSKVETPDLYKDCIIINSDISRFMIKINVNDGSNGINCGNTESGYFSIKKEGRVIFNGKANFATGISIRVDRGNLTFGKNFTANRNCFFSCTENIKIGNDVLVGWNVNIRDTDGHPIFNLDNTKTMINENKPVEIGNHVWVGANVDILKGVVIPDDCIIGYNSCVTKKFTDNNCVIGGYPSKIIQSNVTWSN